MGGNFSVSGGFSSDMATASQVARSISSGREEASHDYPQTTPPPCTKGRVAKDCIINDVDVACKVLGAWTWPPSEPPDASHMSSLTTLIGHSAPVWCSSFTLCGSRVTTCSSDETVRVWGVQGGQQVACLRGHVGVVRACQFSPDSTLLASCSWDKTILLHRTLDFQV